MTTTYQPLPTSEREVLSGEPVAPVSRFNGQGGVRREWWWQDGPVDSCCFCCSLPTGITFLALNDLVFDGIGRAFLGYSLFLASEDLFASQIHRLEENYERSCVGEGASPSTTCEELAHKVHQAEDTRALTLYKWPIFAFLCTVTILAGVVGIWAVISRSAFAAKLYMKIWLPKFGLLVALQLVDTAMTAKAVDSTFSAIVSWNNFLLVTWNCLVCAYFLKVSWSYSEGLKMGAAARAARSSELAANVQPRALQLV